MTGNQRPLCASQKVGTPLSADIPGPVITTHRSVSIRTLASAKGSSADECSSLLKQLGRLLPTDAERIGVSPR